MTALDNAAAAVDAECPAGGPHIYEYLTAWEQAVDDHDRRWHSGYFCVECHHEAPRQDPFDFDGEPFDFAGDDGDPF